jgi:hypothetical protein
MTSPILKSRFKETTMSETFKMYYALAAHAILSSIPFGVNIEPEKIADAARRIAEAMEKGEQVNE